MVEAERGQYAVGYFESWNLESLRAVVDAVKHFGVTELSAPYIKLLDGKIDDNNYSMLFKWRLDECI